MVTDAEGQVQQGTVTEVLAAISKDLSNIRTDVKNYQDSQETLVKQIEIVVVSIAFAQHAVYNLGSL